MNATALVSARYRVARRKLEGAMQVVSSGASVDAEPTQFGPRLQRLGLAEIDAILSAQATAV
jgi:hypothetical protein